MAFFLSRLLLEFFYTLLDQKHLTEVLFKYLVLHQFLVGNFILNIANANVDYHRDLKYAIIKLLLEGKQLYYMTELAAIPYTFQNQMGHSREMGIYQQREVISVTIEEILAGESKNIEFKVQRPKDSTKYMKTVIAFSNGNGGRIIFGVDDATHEVIGIPKDIVFSEIDAITEAISDSCEPVVIPDVYLQTINNKTIIIAEISPGKQRPYYIKPLGIKDGTYIRVSGTSRPAGRDLTAEMYYEDEGRSYDKVIRRDLTVTDDEISELCRQMKIVAIANARSEAQKEAIKDVNKNVLMNWGLLAEAEDGSIRPTNGYIFLLGKDSFLSQIQCGMFKGTTRAVFAVFQDSGGYI